MSIIRPNSTETKNSNIIIVMKNYMTLCVCTNEKTWENKWIYKSMEI